MNIKIGMIGFFVWIAAVLCPPVPSGWSYADAPVTDGATLTGKVVFKGVPPLPRSFGLIVYPDWDLCQRISDGKGHRLLRDFSVSKDGGLRDVVVVVENVPKGKPFRSTGPRITIKDCEFRPFMSVVRDRDTMTYQNEDSVIHDIQTYVIEDNKRGDKLFDRAALADATLIQEFKAPKGQRIVWTQCGKHSFMQTWAYTVDNPYYAITGDDGSFSIPDLPPGRYRVTAWHPFMNLREQTVEVPARSKTVLKFEFGK